MFFIRMAEDRFLFPAGIELKLYVLLVSASAPVERSDTPHPLRWELAAGHLPPHGSSTVQPATGAGTVQLAQPGGTRACPKWLFTLPLWTVRLARAQKADGKGTVAFICRVPRKGGSSGE